MHRPSPGWKRKIWPMARLPKKSRRMSSWARRTSRKTQTYIHHRLMGGGGARRASGGGAAVGSPRHACGVRLQPRALEIGHGELLDLVVDDAQRAYPQRPLAEDVAPEEVVAHVELLDLRGRGADGVLDPRLRGDGDAGGGHPPRRRGVRGRAVEQPPVVEDG